MSLKYTAVVTAALLSIGWLCGDATAQSIQNDKEASGGDGTDRTEFDAQLLRVAFDARWRGNYQRAVKLFEHACEAGNARACYERAWYSHWDYMDYRDMQPKQAATYFYEKSCDGGDYYGCEAYARALEKGLGRAKDEKGADQSYKRARSLAENACGNEDADACTLAAQMSGLGIGGPLESERASELFDRSKRVSEKKCADGDPGACYDIAVRIAGYNTVDDALVLQFFEASCEGGDPRGCYNLARSYDSGDGVPEDSALAKEFYQLACDNHEKKCPQLGGTVPLPRKPSASNPDDQEAAEMVLKLFLAAFAAAASSGPSGASGPNPIDEVDRARAAYEQQQWHNTMTCAAVGIDC